jgi:non-ribosomal peptide synthetase component E (peptide arylation enzyme)
VTYAELSQRSERLARVLLDLGFKPLDRIIVQLPNTAVFAYLYFALQRIGAAPVLALRGYFRSPEHNARAFTQDGFYRSGDLLRKLPSGNYVVEGRVKDLINRGGEKISAEEVENLILSHPAVLNVACVPYPDPVLGERMCACLVLREGQNLGLDQLVRYLLGFEIATFKLPERVAYFDSLPLSGFGKVTGTRRRSSAPGRSTRSRASAPSRTRSPRSASTACSASTSTRSWGTTRSTSPA